MDVIGLKIGFFIFVLLWLLINMVYVLVGGWISLVFLCGLMGLIEVLVILVGIKVSVEWFLMKECGIVGGLFNIGILIGVMLVLLLVVWVMLIFVDSGIGIEMVFVIIGGIGVLFVIIWFLIYNLLNKYLWIIYKELCYIEDGQESYFQDDNKKLVVKEIVKKCNFWVLVIICFLVDLVWGMLSFWMLLYLINVMYLLLKEIVMFVWLLFLVVDFGCVVGGFLVKFFMEKMYMIMINVCCCSFIIGVVLMILIGFVSIMINLYVVIVLMSIGGFVYQMLFIVVIIMSVDLFKKNEVVMVVGLVGFVVWMGQLSFNLFMGVLVVIIGYGLFFIVFSLFDIIGVIILWVLIKDLEKYYLLMMEQLLVFYC